MGMSRILVTDTGATHVACGVFDVAAEGQLLLRQFGIERLNSDPGPEAGAIWVAQTASAFAALAGRMRVGGGVSLAVPGHLALTKFVKTPAIEKSKRAKIIQFEAAQSIPHRLEEVVWDHVVVADDGRDLEIMLMAAKTEVMLALCGAVQAAGLPVLCALPSCLALRQSFEFNYPESRESVLLVNIGARSTHLLFHEPGRFFVRTLPLAGDTVTQAIAGELRIEFAAAEALKRQVLGGRSEWPENSPVRAAVQRAADDFGTRLQLEITRSAVNLRRQAAAAPPVALYLTGGGALIARLPHFLAERLKLPARPYDALRRVEVAPAAAAASSEEHAPLLADLVGLAAQRMKERDADPTLLPRSLREELAVRRHRPRLLAAAALLVLALLPPIWHYDRVAQAAQGKIAAIDAQLRPLRLRQERNARNLDQLERTRRQVAALHRLAETKSSWAAFFRDLQARLTDIEDVWLERLSVVRAPASAGHLSPAAAAAPAPLRLSVGGRLLDHDNPISRVSRDSQERVQRLLASIAESPFIAAVENERYDNGQPGLLRFDFTLVLNPRNPL